MRRRDRLNAIATFIALAGLVSIIALAWQWADAPVQVVIAQDFAYLIATVALYIFVGNSGIFSFGHVAFMAIGAYAASLLAIPRSFKQLNQPNLPHFLADAQWNPLVACVVGGVAAALVALVLSVPLMKLSGLTAALTSFAFLEIVYVVAANWSSVTNGEPGLTGIPPLSGVGELWLVSLVVIGVALVFQQSRWGRRLRASREDEVAARALGMPVTTDRRIAFVLSALFMGVAGGLYAQLLGALVPETLYISLTTLLLIMLIVGGMTSLSGAVIGCITISAVSEVLVKIQDGVTVGGLSIKGPVGIQPVGLALIMLIALLTFPKGLTRCRELTVLAGPLSDIADRLGWGGERRRDRSVEGLEEQ